MSEYRKRLPQMEDKTPRYGMVLMHNGTFGRRWIEWDANGMPYVAIGGFRVTVVPGESVEWLLV